MTVVLAVLAIGDPSVHDDAALGALAITYLLDDDTSEVVIARHAAGRPCVLLSLDEAADDTTIGAALRASYEGGLLA